MRSLPAELPEYQDPRGECFGRRTIGGVACDTNRGNKRSTLHFSTCYNHAQAISLTC